MVNQTRPTSPTMVVRSAIPKFRKAPAVALPSPPGAPQSKVMSAATMAAKVKRRPR